MNINWKLLAAGFLLATASCKKENNKEEDNDNELITTVKITAKDRASSEEHTFIWRDTDGAGGNAPEIDPITLAAGKTYDVQLSVLDESKTPAEDITEEIAEEADAHRFYFIPGGSAGITVADLSKDGNNVSVGLNSVWTTSTPGNGTMKIVLRHYANGGKEESDPVTSTKSTTDAEVEFTVSVEAP